VEIMGGKFSHKPEVLLPSILLTRNFLKENWQYSQAGWENFGAKIFSKLLFGQCIVIMQTIPKAIPESMSRLTDFAVRTPAGFRQPLVYCELGF
jgi:hypothetical protein